MKSHFSANPSACHADAEREFCLSLITWRFSVFLAPPWRLGAFARGCFFLSDNASTRCNRTGPVLGYYSSLSHGGPPSAPSPSLRAHRRSQGRQQREAEMESVIGTRCCLGKRPLHRKPRALQMCTQYCLDLTTPESRGRHKDLQCQCAQFQPWVALEFGPSFPVYRYALSKTCRPRHWRKNRGTPGLSLVFYVIKSW